MNRNQFSAIELTIGQEYLPGYILPPAPCRSASFSSLVGIVLVSKFSHIPVSSASSAQDLSTTAALLLPRYLDPIEGNGKQSVWRNVPAIQRCNGAIVLLCERAVEGPYIARPRYHEGFLSDSE